MKQCEQCGAAIVDGMAFCTNCGAPVNNTAAAPAASMGAPMSAGMPAGGITSAGMTGAGEMPGAPAQMGASSAPTQAPATSMAMGAGAALKDINDRPKNNKALIISLAAACVVCLTVGIVGIVMAATSNNGKSNNDSDRVAVNVENNGSTVDVTSSGTKVQIDKYEVVIPSDYYYETSTQDGLTAVMYTDNENNYFVISSYMEDLTWSTLQSSSSDMADALTAASDTGATVTAENKTVDGVEFIYFNTVLDGYTATYAFSKIDLYCFMSIIVTNDGKTGDSYLDKAATVLSTAQKKRELNRALGTESEIDISKFIDRL